jgi:60 kDa SS-A/Ro ribonucleoprotein
MKNNTPLDVKTANTVNKSGGHAYKRSSEEALAQYAVMGTIGNQYHVQNDGNLEAMSKLVKEASPEFVAKLAIYSRRSAFMKDMSAFLLATLMTLDLQLFKFAFPKVIDNGKMLRTFMKTVRSGVVGRKSFGNAAKKAIQKWLNDRTDHQLVDDSIGNDPSMKDMLMMVHPKPATEERSALYAYLMDKPHNAEILPQFIKDFEAFKKAAKGSRVMPEINWQFLSTLELSNEEWKDIGLNMKWHATRMNINTLQRHGVFADPTMVEVVAKRLADKEQVKRSKVFPYQLFAAYKQTNDAPAQIREALNVAMEAATENVPEIKGKVVVAVDCSGSMRSCIVPPRAGATTTILCNDVASLIAATILRSSKNVDVYRFDTNSVKITLNPSDSVFANANKIGFNGGGTDCSATLRDLNHRNEHVDVMFIVSDNESWADRGYYGASTGVMAEWAKLQQRCPNAKLVCIDLQANASTQATSGPSRLNVGGMSDNVFEVVNQFLSGDTASFVQRIEQVQLS